MHRDAMPAPRRSSSPRASGLAAVVLLACGVAAAQTAPDARDAAIQELQRQLTEQKAMIEAQQRQIERLREKVEGWSTATSSPSAAISAPSSGHAADDKAAASPGPTPSTGPASAHAAGTTTVKVATSASGERGSTGTVHGRFNGIDITLGGAIKTTVLGMTARGQPDGTPFFLLPDFPGQPEGSTKFDARASNVSLAIDGLTWHEYTFGGFALFTLGNGNLLSGGYGFTPLYAYVDARNDTERYAMGLQEDVFSPRIPKMVDMISALAASGNPGNSSRAQLRAERYVPVGGLDKVALIGALSDSLPQTVDPEFSRVTENTGLPNIEVRALYASGQPGDAWIRWNGWELGASGVYGRFRTLSPLGKFDAYTSTLWGATADWRFRLGRQAGFQGELYAGQALGPYLATILQTVNPVTQKAMRSYGGWGEFVWYWSPAVHTHAGYGIDKVRAADLFDGAFSRNQTAFLNLIYDVSALTQLSVEGTWRKTDYLGLPDNQGLGLMLATELRF